LPRIPLHCSFLLLYAIQIISPPLHHLAAAPAGVAHGSR
jgi:hypothetical protein